MVFDIEKRLSEIAAMNEELMMSLKESAKHFQKLEMEYESVRRDLEISRLHIDSLVHIINRHFHVADIGSDNMFMVSKAAAFSKGGN